MDLNPLASCTTGRAADEVVELEFLLPNSYAAALEAAAHSRGQTTGQVIRDLIRRFLGEGCGE